MREPPKFSGIMPANILPFHADLSIDERAYRAHLRWLADVRGVTAIVVNGHAAEVASLSREERRRALAIALDEVGARRPLVARLFEFARLVLKLFLQIGTLGGAASARSCWRVIPLGLGRAAVPRFRWSTALSATPCHRVLPWVDGDKLPHHESRCALQQNSLSIGSNGSIASIRGGLRGGLLTPDCRHKSGHAGTSG